MLIKDKEICGVCPVSSLLDVVLAGKVQFVECHICMWKSQSQELVKLHWEVGF